MKINALSECKYKIDCVLQYKQRQKHQDMGSAGLHVQAEHSWALHWPRTAGYNSGLRLRKKRTARGRYQPDRDIPTTTRKRSSVPPTTTNQSH